MRLSGEVLIDIGGRKLAFALRGRQVEQLEHSHGAIVTLTRTLMQEESSYAQILDVLALGLEGAGMAMVEADAVMVGILAREPVAVLAAAARVVMSAAWVGVAELMAKDGAESEEASKGDFAFDAAGWRGKMLQVGADPSYVDTHSMYEIFSTFRNAVEKQKELSNSDHSRLLEALAEREKRMAQT